MSEAADHSGRTESFRASGPPAFDHFMTHLKTQRIKVWGLIIVASIVAAGVAIYLAGKGFEKFAGAATVVNINVVLGLSVAISISVAGVAGVIAALRQRELRRLRARNITLERNARELKHRLLALGLDAGTSAGSDE